MGLPRIQPEFAVHHVEGVGDIKMRPLSRGELVELQETVDSDPLGAQAQACELAIDGDGDDVLEWLNDLPGKLATRVFDTIVELSMGSDDAEVALGN